MRISDWSSDVCSSDLADHPLIVPGEAYFLHGYAFEGERVLAVTDHDGPVTAAIGRDNMLGVQFHPEKSQRYGIALLERFLAWRPGWLSISPSPFPLAPRAVPFPPPLIGRDSGSEGVCQYVWISVVRG